MRPWWPDLEAWDAVVLNAAGERWAAMMASLPRLRSALETVDSLIVCIGVGEDDQPDEGWLASNRVTVLAGAVDPARLGLALGDADPPARSAGGPATMS